MLFMVLLAALALLFVIGPLLWRVRASSAREDSVNASLAWYQQRLSLLAEEAADPVSLAEMEEELAAVLLAEHPQEALAQAEKGLEPVGDASWTPQRVTNALLVFGILLLAIASLTYARLGSMALPELQGAEAVLSLSPETQRDEILTWVQRLEARAAQTEDAKVLYLLGHGRMKLSDFQQAERDFARASALSQGDPSVDFYWFQARYLAAQGVLDQGSRELAEKILRADPNNAQVLEILAVAAIGEGDAETAIRMLNRTLNNPVTVEREKATATAIANLRETLVEQVGPKIRVAVSASAMPPAGATVFVVARPPGGGMPFAVARRSVALLPFDVVLDDLVSMSEQRKLSQASEIEVAVRISASGSATAQEGDWSWRSGALDWAQPGGDETKIATISANVSPPDG